MRELLKKNTTSDGLLFISLGYTFSVLWNKGEGNIIENGNGVLLKFSCLTNVQKYIFEVYYPMQTFSTLQFEVQFVSLHKNNDDLAGTSSDCANKIIAKARTAEKRAYEKGTDVHEQVKAVDRVRKARQFENIKGTDLHEQLKEGKRIQRMLYFENIKGTDLHENKKSDDRKRKFEQFDKLLGTSKHEVQKKAKRMRQAQKDITIAKKVFTSIERIERFRCQINQGPYFICVCCQRGLYKNSTVLYKPDKYQIRVEDYTNLKMTYDLMHYMCKTCHSKLLKGNVPCQAVWNKLEVDSLPPALHALHKLEKTMISKRILFSKVLIMPKGQMPKIKGAICNVPIDVSEVHKILPGGADSNGLISVKLKRKLAYRGHVLFEPVRPGNVQCALEFLKKNNPLYCDVVIDIDQIPPE